MDRALILTPNDYSLILDMHTGTPDFIVLCFIVFCRNCFYYKLKDYGNPVSNKYINTTIVKNRAFPFSRGSSQPGIEPRFPTLQADSLPAEPQGKPFMHSKTDQFTLQITVGTDYPACYSPWCRRVGHDLVTEQQQTTSGTQEGLGEQA